MESMFKTSFRSFLESSYIDFIEYGDMFVFPEFEFSVCLIAAYTRGPGITLGTPKIASSDVLYLYEDRWWAARKMVQERIFARLERFRSVFARKCRVLTGRNNPAFGEMVREFLEKHHSYSSAKCRYRFALEYEGEIVAVATFSQGRPMVRKVESPLLNVPREEQQNADIVVFDSYEWVRYASLPGVRVVGGMGKLLNAFIEERLGKIGYDTPMEIMTYSDTEWSNGDVYTKLGFSYAGEREPVLHYVHKKNYTRLSQRLYEKALQEGFLPDDFYTIYNKGSKKFLLQITPEII